MKKLFSSTIALLAICSLAFGTGMAKGQDYGHNQPFHDRVCLLLKSIPDHDCVTEEARAYMTDDLYWVLKSAWDVPQISALLGGIGDEEFLWYFVSGNGGEWPLFDEMTIGAITEVDRTHIRFPVAFCQGGGNYVCPSPWIMHLQLVYRNDEWILDDFDNVKNRCRTYITEATKSYISGEDEKAIRNSLAPSDFPTAIQQYKISWLTYMQTH